MYRLTWRRTVWQRIPVAISCVAFIFLLDGPTSNRVNVALFSLTVLLACIEKLAAMGNTIAVERDWVIVISSGLSIPREDLNATMRRIDLFCKLVAPLFISFIDTFSTRVAIYTVIGLNTFSALIEYYAIAHVYHAIPQLSEAQASTQDTQDTQDSNPPTGTTVNPSTEARSVLRRICAYLSGILSPWTTYIHSPAFLASFSLTLLYLTVLSTGPQMSTYLLSLGFTPLHVSVMRLISVILELSATFAAPLLMRKIGVIRAGLWFINEQLACVLAAAAAFLLVRRGETGRVGDQLRGAALIAGVALSRLGLWGFDLSVQYVVQQVRVPGATRMILNC